MASSARTTKSKQRKWKQPNWDLWRYAVNVELWQAVALTCDIDPDELRGLPGPYEAWGPDEYDRRLQAAKMGAPSSDRSPRTVELFSHAIVNLDSFLFWALSFDKPWSIPRELSARVAKLAKRELERRGIKHHAPPAGKLAAPAEQAKEISERREATLLKQVAALALLLSKNGAYRNGDDPNASAIATAIKTDLFGKPKDDKWTPSGLSDSRLGDSIEKGRGLLQAMGAIGPRR